MNKFNISLAKQGSVQPNIHHDGEFVTFFQNVQRTSDSHISKQFQVLIFEQDNLFCKLKM